MSVFSFTLCRFLLSAYSLRVLLVPDASEERERERGRKRIVLFFVSSLKEKSNGVFEVWEQSRNFAAETLHLFPNKKKKNKSSSSSSLFFVFCSTWFFGALERMVDWMKVLLLQHAFGGLTECRSKIV